MRSPASDTITPCSQCPMPVMMSGTLIPTPGIGTA